MTEKKYENKKEILVNSKMLYDEKLIPGTNKFI
jgi:hypothetical protein